ncbi:uncharacterized protein LOC121877837 [Homarus americanus]|uniref:uncharacterized protein LOC121877837 n=1 Tax=Homarus americanus TaxID=6706 RepID=UPI001C457F82|nr:uncharacterized protein LOC121877837 [Homarus americanus]
MKLENTIKQHATKVEALEQENQRLCKKLEQHQQHVKKVSELEGSQQKMQIELSQTKAQLKEAQERLDMCNSSIHEQSTDEATATMQGLQLSTSPSASARLPSPSKRQPPPLDITRCKKGIEPMEMDSKDELTTDLENSSHYRSDNKRHRVRSFLVFYKTISI